MKNICYISCYHQVNYTRRIQFIQALDNQANIKAYFVLNESKSAYRYIEVIMRLIRLRCTKKIDIFILGFRGNELFFPVRLITIGKPLYFDAFVPFYNALVLENKWQLPRILRSILGMIVYYYEKWSMQLSHTVFTDTASHKAHFIDVFNIKKEKINAIYLGCPENLQGSENQNKIEDSNFNIFFYGTMQPLHGIEHILEVARRLQTKNKKIKIQIVGGQVTVIQSFIQKNQLTNIEYYTWLEKEKLFSMAAEAHLCLGGPLGNTPQAQNVITGKTFQFFKLGKCTVVGRNAEVQMFPFEDKKNCLLVPLGDSEQLFKTIEWAWQHQEQLEAIGQKAKAMYETHFDPKQLEATLLATLK